MTSPFDDNFAEMGVPALMDELGEPVQADYLQVGQADVKITMILGGVQDDEQREGGRRSRVLRTATMSRDSSSPYGGVANPSLEGRVKIGVEEWAVRRIVQQSESLTTVEIVRTRPIEVSRPGYRASS